MKKSLLLVSLLFASYCFAATSPIRIVCMGNSITQGNIDKAGSVFKQLSWRYSLWQKLDSAAISIDMVGYTPYFFDENADNLITPPVSKYTGHVFDRDHDAYYGIESSGLLNGDGGTAWTGAALPSLAVRLNSYTPDIALLHIGTNDADEIVTTTVENIEAMIDALRVKNPNVVVFVAKTITTWKAINSYVYLIANDKNTVQSPVIAVDLATGFINDPKKAGTMTWDWVHPNPLGQEFMAKGWFAAIKKQLDITTELSEYAHSQSAIEVYPSISNGEITIKASKNALVQIYNTSGNMLKSSMLDTSGANRLNLSELNNGLYIIHINENGNHFSKKIIISK